MKTLRLAAVAALALLLAFCAGTAPAFADNVVPVCMRVPLPGRENTLNPFDPPEKQVQDTRRECVTVRFPDPAHVFDKGPVTDFHHDPRAFA